MKQRRKILMNDRKKMWVQTFKKIEATVKK